MRKMCLYKDEKEYLYANYSIGEKYEITDITDLDDCDYLKVGLKGILTEIDNNGYFVVDWDDGFDSHGEFPNWLQRDKLKKIS